MTCDDDVYAAVIRQGAHDAVRALLTAQLDSVAGSCAVREVTTWLAEAFDALAAAEGRPALAVCDGWFHDVPPPPAAAAAPHPATHPGEDPRGREERDEPTGGGAAS